MSFVNALLIILGCAAALVVFCLLALFLKKKLPSEMYDERQEAARGDACQVSLFIGITWNIVVFFWMMNDVMPAEDYLLLFIGLMIQLMTFNIYCLLTHAAMPFSEKPVYAIMSYSTLGLVNLIRLYMGWEYWEGMPLKGKGCAKWAYLIAGVSFLLLAVMHLISLLWKEKE